MKENLNNKSMSKSSKGTNGIYKFKVERIIVRYCLFKLLLHKENTLFKKIECT